MMTIKAKSTDMGDGHAQVSISVGVGDIISLLLGARQEAGGDDAVSYIMLTQAMVVQAVIAGVDAEEVHSNVDSCAAMAEKIIQHMKDMDMLEEDDGED